jgi:hypothetical protein
MNATYTPTLPDQVDVRALAVAISEQVEALKSPLYVLLRGEQGVVRLAGLCEAFCLLTHNEVPRHEHSTEEHGCKYMQAIVDMAAAVAATDSLTATMDPVEVVP